MYVCNAKIYKFIGKCLFAYFFTRLFLRLYIRYKTVVFSQQILRFTVDLYVLANGNWQPFFFSAKKLKHTSHMKTNLVTIQEAKAVTSSLQVAQVFGKEHKNVLKDIKNLAAQNSATKLYFTESQYENRGKWYPVFIINRDGFTLLAMGFTGKKALQFKIDYINAFNRMEEYIKNQSVQNPLPSPHGKYRRKRVETYLPADDALRLHNLAYNKGYNSTYQLLQEMIYDFLAHPYAISQSDWHALVEKEREGWRQLFADERTNWISLWKDRGDIVGEAAKFMREMNQTLNDYKTRLSIAEQKLKQIKATI